MKNQLTFSNLRYANRLRLPQFRGKNGQLAHRHADGHDWTPAQWLQAVIGELGEYARARIAFESGALTEQEYEVMAHKELADVVMYLDILAARCLDVTAPNSPSPAQVLQTHVALLGEYANERKKLERGDHTFDQYRTLARPIVHDMADSTLAMGLAADLPPAGEWGGEVEVAHPYGVDLGLAVTRKFNEVSERAGADVFLVDDGGAVTVRAK